MLGSSVIHCVTLKNNKQALKTPWSTLPYQKIDIRYRRKIWIGIQICPKDGVSILLPYLGSSQAFLRQWIYLKESGDMYKKNELKKAKKTRENGGKRLRQLLGLIPAVRQRAAFLPKISKLMMIWRSLFLSKFGKTTAEKAKKNANLAWQADFKWYLGIQTIGQWRLYIF